jgi:hypothetical protein
MKIIGNIFIQMTIALVVINVFMLFVGEKNYSVYFLVSAVTYLVVTQLNIGLNSGLRSALNWINAGIFLVFLVILGIKVFETIRNNS